ncbi:MAG: hypothetical protein AAFQ59_05350 [Pseudomonadota bacterium]
MVTPDDMLTYEDLTDRWMCDNGWVGCVQPNGEEVGPDGLSRKSNVRDTPTVDCGGYAFRSMQNVFRDLDAPLAAGDDVHKLAYRSSRNGYSTEKSTTVAEAHDGPIAARVINADGIQLERGCETIAASSTGLGGRVAVLSFADLNSIVRLIGVDAADLSQDDVLF